MGSTLIDMIGKKFGRLTVIKRVDDSVSKTGRRNACYLCRCDCGNSKVVQGRHLRDGSTVSCGCYARENKSEIAKKYIAPKRCDWHSLINTRIYRIWGNMVNRCTNKNNPVYDRYGGRGICVCDEWRAFTTFYDWTTHNGYNEELTIDRIDNNDGYNPENCRWVGLVEQENNKRNNVIVTYKDNDYTLSELGRKYNIPYKVLHNRIRLGWSVERAVEQPIRKMSKPNTNDD